MPRESYDELLTPMSEMSVAGADNKDIEYDGKNMEAIVVILDFLKRRLENTVNVLAPSYLLPVVFSWQLLRAFLSDPLICMCDPG